MIKVLLAEDHVIVRNGIKTLLEKAGNFKIIGEAKDGTEVLELLGKGNVPDILLSDINMPGISGMELAEKVKADYPTVKVVLLTMLDNENFVIKAFAAGAHGYLLKTISSDEMIFALNHINLDKLYICSDLSVRFLNRIATMPSNTNKSPLIAHLEFSDREMEILELIADGKTNHEVADLLFLSKRTVEGHRKGMLEKTETRNTPALIRYAIRNGLIN